MLIYIICLSIIIFLSSILYQIKNITNKDKLFLVFSSVPLFLLAAVRDISVGTDTASYVKLFIKISNTDFSNLHQLSGDKGYIYYNKILSYFSSSPQLIIAFNSFIIILLSVCFIYRYSNNVRLSLYLFITLNFYQNSFNVTRCFIAILLVYYFIDLLEKKKLLKFLLVVSIASLIHPSVLIFILLYFLNYIKLSYKKLLVLTISVFIINLNFYVVVWVVNQLSNARYIFYLEKYKGGAGISVLVISCIFLFCVFFFKKVVNSNSSFNLSMWMAFLAWAFYVFATQSYVMIRVGDLFSLYFIISIPQVLCRISDTRLRLVITMIVVILTFSYYVLSGILIGTSSTVPYKCFL